MTVPDPTATPSSRSSSVAVLTTVYNGLEHLPETVSSVLRQTVVDFEFVVVDDGSTDGSREYIEGITDARVRPVLLPRSGRGAALNAGLRACTADLVAILDADDVASRVRLEAQVQWMAEHPDASVIACSCCFEVDGLVQVVPTDYRFERVVHRELLRQNPLPHSAVIMRKDAVLALGGYDTNRSCLFDYDLWIRLAVHDHVLARVGVALVFKRLHSGQTFERGPRLAYLRAGFRERRHAARVFTPGPVDRLYPFIGFVYGLLPHRFRRTFFRWRHG